MFIFVVHLCIFLERAGNFFTKEWTELLVPSRFHHIFFVSSVLRADSSEVSRNGFHHEYTILSIDLSLNGRLIWLNDYQKSV